MNVEELIKLHKIKHLTKKQKHKVEQIAKLMEDLENGGVYICAISAPSNGIYYYRANRKLPEMEDVQDLHNHKTHYVYYPRNQPKSLDILGY